MMRQFFYRSTAAARTIMTSTMCQICIRRLQQMIQSKFKQLQNKLNSLGPPGEQGQHSAKLKMRNIQNLLAKLQKRFDEENELYDQKVTGLFETLRKVENGIKDNSNDLQVQESSWASRAGKLEKSLRKAMQRVGKERKQSDKKLQGALETYLIQLTGFKGKAGSSCAASIRQLRQLQKDVESLQREVKRQTQLSQDIYRKVHSQFKSQINEISCNLDQEQRERTQSEQQLFDAIQRMYQTLNGAILEGRKLRERQQREVVDLLDRVIDKLRREMASD